MMGSSRAHEVARKARRLVLIPEYQELFYDGSDVARKAARERLELWNLSAESDKELRLSLAEAQQNCRNAAGGPTMLKAFLTREKHMVEAARALAGR